MKRLLLYFIIFLPFISIGQTSISSIKIDKIVIDSKKSFRITKSDSTTTIIVDTLIMKDKSILFLVDKKKLNLIVNYAIIGKDCMIEGNDGKNNGADLISQ